MAAMYWMSGEERMDISVKDNKTNGALDATFDIKLTLKVPVFQRIGAYKPIQSVAILRDLDE